MRPKHNYPLSPYIRTGAARERVFFFHSLRNKFFAADFTFAESLSSSLLRNICQVIHSWTICWIFVNSIFTIYYSSIIHLITVLFWIFTFFNTYNSSQWFQFRHNLELHLYYQLSAARDVIDRTKTTNYTYIRRELEILSKSTLNMISIIHCLTNFFLIFISIFCVLNHSNLNDQVLIKNIV